MGSPGTEVLWRWMCSIMHDTWPGRTVHGHGEEGTCEALDLTGEQINHSIASLLSAGGCIMDLQVSWCACHQQKWYWWMETQFTLLYVQSHQNVGGPSEFFSEVETTRDHKKWCSGRCCGEGKNSSLTQRSRHCVISKRNWLHTTTN